MTKTYARILGTGSFLPERHLTNADLAKRVNTNNEWIVERTGIRERRLSENGTASMAAEAAQQALADAEISAEELDLVIAATSTPDYAFPGVACQVQAAIGANRAFCFDLAAACSGFLYALSTAAAYIESGIARKILVIGADAMSKITNWEDRGTCILFGDGAGAAVLTAASTGLMAFDLGTSGRDGGSLTCPFGTDPEELPYIHMDGRRVFQFAVRTVPETIRRVLAEASWEKDEVRYYFLHQANARILASVARTLQIPEEKIPMNIAYCGNTSAASIPILLDEWNRAGRISPGDKLVLAGFGAGLTWGAAALEW